MASTSTPEENPELAHSRIPRVPEGHGYGGRDAYKPSIISIGPYHRDQPTLVPMELLKHECFKRLQDESKKKWTAEECVKELQPVEKTARKYYLDNAERMEDTDFLEMMLLDACFIIEYCYCIQEDISSARNEDAHIKTKKLSYLLGGRIWMDTAIRNDLLLLENQIPFFVVEKVFSIFQVREPSQLLVSIEYFCGYVSPINTNQSSDCFPGGGGQLEHHLGEIKHLLDFYHNFLFCRTGNTSVNTALPYAEKPIRTIRSATLLEEAGIKLEKVSNKEKGGSPEEATIEFELGVDSVMNVTFQPNGIMKITPLFIDAFTVSQFRNLIALEKHNSYLEPQATAFAQFMDYIINTSKDVDLLRQNGILEHSLGSDEEIATIFNQLTSGIHEYRTLKMEKIYKDVDKYCKTKHHRWLATLMKDYCGSPWKAISLGAAVILLSLTFIQTFFSMYSYFRPPSGK